MTIINNINIEFLNLKTEIYLNNYINNIDTVNNIITIISGPAENLIPIYSVKDIILAKNNQITQIIKE